MNAFLMQQVEIGKQNLVHRETDYEMMKAAMTCMERSEEHTSELQSPA